LADRTTDWIESKHVLWGVFVASLAETLFVPIPIETVLIPVMLTNRDRLWRIATIALVGCLVGATLGYIIGCAAYDAVGQPIIDTLGLASQFEEYKAKIDGDGFWYVLIIALTPVPFQIAYVGAGVVQMSFLLFFAAAILGRGVRYFGLAGLVVVLGKAAGPWLERNKYKLAIWATVAFVGGYIAIKLIG
jgi:membrane protein YqaA with SNARE-associated domain